MYSTSPGTGIGGQTNRYFESFYVFLFWNKVNWAYSVVKKSTHAACFVDLFVNPNYHHRKKSLKRWRLECQSFVVIGSDVIQKTEKTLNNTKKGKKKTNQQKHQLFK